MVEKVHILHKNAFRHEDMRGSVIQNALYACLNQIIGSFLRSFGRSGDDADLHVLPVDKLANHTVAQHFHAKQLFTYLERVAVESAEDMIATFFEGSVVEQSPA